MYLAFADNIKHDKMIAAERITFLRLIRRKAAAPEQWNTEYGG